MLRLLKRNAVLIIAILVSFFGHIGVVQGLSKAARNAPKEEPRKIEFTVIKPEPPPPPPEPEPEKPKPKKKIDLKTPPKVEVPPPSNTEVSDTPPEKAKPVFGMTNKSFSNNNSGFKVRYGNTTMKEREEDFTKPEEVKTYKAVPSFKVNKAPKRRGECKGTYPQEADDLGIEGSVKLQVEVLADGRVGVVKVIKGLGYGLDQAAVRALKKCRFSPAYVGEEAVITNIPYTYTWILED